VCPTPNSAVLCPPPLTLPQAGEIRFLALQLVFNDSVALLRNDATTTATNPVWRDMSHMSNDRELLQVHAELGRASLPPFPPRRLRRRFLCSRSSFGVLCCEGDDYLRERSGRAAEEGHLFSVE